MSQLKQRGIAESAKKAGWLGNDTKQRYEYPVWGIDGKVIATRTKAYDSKAAMKYGWLPSKPDNTEADWYLLPGTKHHIKVAGGVAYLANGEAALLAFHAAGIHNVIATCHGENTVPKNTVEYLRAIGVNSLINIPDKDEAGVKGAIKWRDALRDSGIGYQAKQWPDYLPEKSDFNDLWIHVAFDAQAARKALNECQALILPQPAVKTPVLPDLPRGEAPSSLIDALVSELRARGHRKQNKEWLNGLSVMRSEQNASAGMSLKTGWYYDFGTGESYPPSELAAVLGINPDAFYPEKPTKKAKAPAKKAASYIHEYTKEDEQPKAGASRRETVITDTSDFITIADSYNAQTKGVIDEPHLPGAYPVWTQAQELPASWIKAMNHLTHAKSMTVIIAILLHRAFLRGQLNGSDFTIQEIMNVLSLPRKSSQGAIDALLAWNFFRILETNNKEKDMDAESGKNSEGAGRPEIRYALNTDTEDLKLNLVEILEAALLERLCHDRLAPRLPSLRNSMDLDLEAYRLWHDRNDSPQHQQIKETIQAWVNDVLYSDVYYVFEDKDLESPSALRGKLLRIKLAPYAEDVKARDKHGNPVLDEKGKEIIIRPKGIQISRADLALELGTSESSMTKLYRENNIGVKRMREWLTVLNPNGADIEKELREAPNKLNASLGGVTVGFKMKVYSYGKDRWLDLVYTKNAKAAFQNWDGRLIRMDIWVEQPSLLWPMNADEIAAKKAVKEAEIEALEAEAEGIPVVVEKEGEKAKESKEAKPKKERTVVGHDRIYKGHKPDFEQEQIAREVHRFTLHRMVGMSILNAASEVVFSAKSYRDFVPWLNENASKTALRDDSTYGALEVIPAPVAQPVPAKVAAPALEDEGINWAENVELFYERMRALGG